MPEEYVKMKYSREKEELRRWNIDDLKLKPSSQESESGFYRPNPKPEP